MQIDTEQVETLQSRLEVLWHKLESDGAYVSANTVHMAQQLIHTLTGIAARPITLDSGDST
jgi:hypothetical protein